MLCLDNDDVSNNWKHHVPTINFFRVIANEPKPFYEKSLNIDKTQNETTEF